MNHPAIGYDGEWSNSEGIGIGPGGRTDAATYASLLEDCRDRILSYPDGKHWLVAEKVTGEWLAEIDPGA